MKELIGLVAFCLLSIERVAVAYEYPLQFKPNAGYRGLVIAGYMFQGSDVVGNCSYYTVSGRSGKGGGGGRAKNYPQTCTWDSHSLLPERGFVSSFGSHYTWLTPSNNAVLYQFVYTLMATLKSDGDVPVDISSVGVSALHGTAVLKHTDCNGVIDVGSKCSITLTYDPTQLEFSTGLATDTLRIDLASDAGEAHDFIQNLTIILANHP